jgi:L-alanine-DL-glutamate epimerase-like enolase superfamily enzyme
MMHLDVRPISWEMTEPFTISRGTTTHMEGVLAVVTDGVHRGRGESYGIPYAGETPQSMIAQIEAVRGSIESGMSRAQLLELLPAGGARCAIDFALWDLEAKQSGRPVRALAGINAWEPLATTFTIGMRSRAQLQKTALRYLKFEKLKIKVDGVDPIDTLRALREVAPGPRLIVDPNQSWSLAQLREYAPMCKELGVVLLEQPVAVDADEGLRGYRCPIPIAADELVGDLNDLPKARAKYSVINIKLDKAGGLTEGLRLAHAAIAEGFELMVGCMAGSSLSMAPAFVLGQLCRFVDLDGPLLQKEDWPDAIEYRHGIMSPPSARLWG